MVFISSGILSNNSMVKITRPRPQNSLTCDTQTELIGTGFGILSPRAFQQAIAGSLGPCIRRDRIRWLG